MTEPALQHLYVMQNACGLIKIGRSIDPDQRRRVLQTTEDCDIRLLLVLPGEGAREEAVHIALADHHIEGEWFDGGEPARAAVQQVLGVDIRFPYTLEPRRADAWLQRFFSQRDDKAIKKDLLRWVSTLRTVERPDWREDARIWQTLCLMERGELVTVQVAKGGHPLTGRLSDTETVVIPRYHQDLSACLDLWPEEVRPGSWDGSPLSCAVAALEQRRQRYLVSRR